MRSEIGTSLIEFKCMNFFCDDLPIPVGSVAQFEVKRGGLETRRCEFKSHSRQKILHCSLQCHINTNLVLQAHVLDIYLPNHLFLPVKQLEIASWLFMIPRFITEMFQFKIITICN